MNSLRKIVKFIALYPITFLIWIFLKVKYKKESLTFSQVKLFVIRDFGALSLRLQLGNSKLQTTKKLNFSKYKKSDTVFIFGSGSSINDLSESDWSHIHKHDAIPMNYSFIEEKIKPTFFYNELTHDPKYWDVILDNIEKREDYKKAPMIIQYANFIKQKISTGVSFYDKLTNVKKDNIFMQMPYYHPIPDKKILSDFLKYRSKPKGMLPFTKSTLIHHLGSLSMIINLAYLAGYKKIVLMGIDMKDSRYFYQDTSYNQNSSALLMRENIPPNSEEKPHNNVKETLYEAGFVPGDEYVKIFNEVVLNPNGVDLFIGSKKALLYPELPYYFESIG
ncbi:MAG: hypothetical protein ACK5HU_02160 [Flavobacteriales bacterium]